MFCSVGSLEILTFRWFRTWLRASWNSFLFLFSSNSPSKAEFGTTFLKVITFSPNSLYSITRSRFGLEFEFLLLLLLLLTLLLTFDTSILLVSFLFWLSLSCCKLSTFDPYSNYFLMLRMILMRCPNLMPTLVRSCSVQLMSDSKLSTFWAIRST